MQRGVNEWIEKEAEERDTDVEVSPFSNQEMLSMLEIIQDLDPPGVGARDLRECLLLQLRAAGQRDSLAYRLVDESFEELIALPASFSSQKTRSMTTPSRRIRQASSDFVATKQV